MIAFDDTDDSWPSATFTAFTHIAVGDGPWIRIDDETAAEFRQRLSAGVVTLTFDPTGTFTVD